MKVAVLGGGGHLGAACCHHFAASGATVTAVTRPGRTYAAINDLAVEQVARDVNELDAGFYGQFDAVIDCAAPYPLYLDQSWREQGAAAERRLAGLGQALQGEAVQYIYISSFVALRRQQTVGQTLARSLASHPYHACKFRLERLARRAQESAPNLTIVYPSACFGPFDTRAPTHCYLPELAAERIPAVTDQLINVVDVRDVAAAIAGLLLAEEPRRRAPLFGHAIGSARLSQLACELLGVAPPPVLPVPAVAANALILGLESLGHLTGNKPMAPALPVLLMNESYQVECAPIATRALDETLIDALAWYRELGYL